MADAPSQQEKSTENISSVAAESATTTTTTTVSAATTASANASTLAAVSASATEQSSESNATPSAEELAQKGIVFEQAQGKAIKMAPWLKSMLLNALVYVLLLCCFSHLYVVQATPLVLHELTGVAVCLVVIGHVVLFKSFFGYAFRQKSGVLLYRDVIVSLLFAAFVITTISGVGYSHELFDDIIRLPGDRRMWHTIHTVAAAYLMILIGFHLGCYLNKFYTFLGDTTVMLMGTTGVKGDEASSAQDNSRKVVCYVHILLHVCLGLIAFNGAMQFYATGFYHKLFAERVFSFYDFDRSAIWNVVDQVSIAMLFMVISAIIYRFLLHKGARQ